MGAVFDGALSPNPHYYEITGRAAEIARALGSPAGGAEHLFLGILHDGGWLVSSPLSTAIIEALPEDTTFGFNSVDGRTWVHVFGADGGVGADVTRELLNAALSSLGRPTL
jgi:hypothetical protein